MVNKCVVIGCKSGYKSESTRIPTFSFPLTKPQLLEKWIDFVNRKDWRPTKNSVICLNHFDKKLLGASVRRTKLNWKLNPVPTIHCSEKERLYYSKISTDHKERPITKLSELAAASLKAVTPPLEHTSELEKALTIRRQSIPRQPLKVKLFSNRQDLDQTRKSVSTSYLHLNLTSTNSSNNSKKRPSIALTPPLKILKVETYQDQQSSQVLDNNLITSFEELSAQHAPPSYTCFKAENEIIFYQLILDQNSKFPRIEGAIKVDKRLQVQLQYREKPVPLPVWFAHNKNTKLTNISVLKNFSSYLSSFESSERTFLDELSECQYHKQDCSFSQQLIRFAKSLRNTSISAYELLLQHFPFPSVSFLERLRFENC